MSKFLSLIMILFLLAGFGTAFVNLCSPLKSASCHGNHYNECHYKPSYTSDIAKIQIIMPSFDIVCLLDCSISKPIQANKSINFTFIAPPFLEHYFLAKFSNPSNAPPFA